MAQMMSRAHALSAVVLLVACGDDGGSSQPDAGTVDARVFDAPPDDCDYTEQNDTGNDTTESGTSESTGITFGTRTVICGTIDESHFDGSITVDVDSFSINAAADTDVIVRFVAPNANLVELVGVDVYDSTNALRGTLSYYGNHGVVSARLAAGASELLAIALHGESITTPIPYRIEITADVPDTRCPEVTAGGYTEQNDTAQDDGNDVFDYPSGAPAAFTSATDDAPEPTNIVLAPDVNIRLAGESANVTNADKYEDTDTFEIATGAGTNELTVRLTWPTTGANLEWFLYEENTTAPTLVTASLGSAALSEVKLTAVKPNTTYWLTVNALAGTTVPTDYNATLCGAQFTP